MEYNGDICCKQEQIVVISVVTIVVTKSNNFMDIIKRDWQNLRNLDINSKERFLTLGDFLKHQDKNIILKQGIF